MFSHIRFVRLIISTLVLYHKGLSSNYQQVGFARVKDARGHAAKKH